MIDECIDAGYLFKVLAAERKINPRFKTLPCKHCVVKPKIDMVKDDDNLMFQIFCLCNDSGSSIKYKDKRLCISFWNMAQRRKNNEN